MIYLELVSLKGVALRAEVHEVILPTTDGQIAVFAHHAPLVSTTANGILYVRLQPNHPDDMMESYAVNAGGVIEIGNERVRVLVDEADHSDDIDEKEVIAARARAKQLASESKDQKSLDEALSAIDRQAVRLRITEFRRRTKR